VLNELKIDKLLDKVDSRYGLVLASAKRARQINEYTRTLGLNDSLGIPGPQVHIRSQHPLSIAIEELREDKLKVGFAEETSPEEEQVGAADGDAFLNSPGSAPSSPAPEDEGEEDREDQGAA
jgi:DNA-directed RNA polymerase subunit omega